MTVLLMSDKELSRVDTLQRLARGELTLGDAVQLLRITERHLRRLRARLATEGAAGLASRKRGKPSNHQMPAKLRAEAIALVRAHYPDFGPTFAAEKLAECHDLHLSKETLRKLMIADGLWRDRKVHRARVHQPRARRECLGELIQIDGCEHWWFEDRGPQCTLLVYIDDATSRLMHLQFAPSESAMAYMQATRAYIEAHGKPIAFYSDRHGIFRINRPEAKRGDGMTQFGRALHELNIDIICASSAPAKGRVERAHQTLQDRLVKELRLAGIASIAAANEWLPGFITRHNARFAKPPLAPEDRHRPLAPHDDPVRALAWREQRTLTASLTLHYDKVMFILEDSALARSLVRQRLDVIDRPDGTVELQHQGTPLPYSTFDKLVRTPAPVVDHKRLGEALNMARELQATRPHHRQRNNAGPARSAQASHMFPAPAKTPKIDRRTLGLNGLKPKIKATLAE